MGDPTLHHCDANIEHRVAEAAAGSAGLADKLNQFERLPGAAAEPVQLVNQDDFARR